MLSDSAAPWSLPPSNYRRADEQTYSDLERLDHDRTICFCAVSALEVHGPHLPIGSDLHQACWMADETARRFAERHPDWTATVYRVVRAFGEQLVRAGFRYIVLTNAHGGPRHAAALEAASIRISKRRGVAMITPSIRALHRMVSGAALDEVEAFLGRPLTPDERHGATSGEHAGTWETAWYLARRPELVSQEFKSLGADVPPRWRPLERLGQWLERRTRAKPDAVAKGLPLHAILDSLAGGIGWMLNARFGYGRNGERATYHGWPGVATAELGEAYAELPVRMCLEDVEAVVEGRLDPTEVKSIASDPLLIQPGVLRWAGIGAAALILGLVWLAL
jgi:creatinine amidohydrolase/Fe(II)-dependent formamide hydrolase-like protein